MEMHLFEKFEIANGCMKSLESIMHFESPATEGLQGTERQET